MFELQEKLFFLQCKYEVAFNALMTLSAENHESSPVVETALNRIAEIGERERRRDSMREPELPHDTF